MYYRIAVDTFHVGLKCGFDGVDYVLSEIKKNLFFMPEITKSRNPYYLYGWSYPEIGFNVFFDTKSGVANCPVSIELDGKFFRHDYAELFLDWLISNFGQMFLIQRCDVCIDVIYESVDDLKKVENFDVNSPFYLGFPVPSVKEEFQYQIAPFEGHFDLIDGKVKIDLLSSGRGEKKLRVYDKDLDLQRKENKTYQEIYCLKAFRVFRIEYAVRSDSIKGLFDKYKDKITCSSDFVYLLLSGLFKRFSFSGVTLDNVFKEDVSFYLKKEGSTLDNQITDVLNKMRKLSDTFCVLNEKKYREKVESLGGYSDLYSRNMYLKQVDFYDIAEKLGQL